MGQFPPAEFIQYLTRLSITPVIPFGRLQFGKLCERTTDKARMHDHGLQTNDQTITAKDGHIPWDAGRRQPHIGREVMGIQAQRAYIFNRLLVQPVDILIGSR
jgi:hypothetical protein